MAGDWIRIRRGIRQWPKTVAIARQLASSREFMNWWSDPVQQHCVTNVTEIVTFANVTRVTACALVELWFAINDVVGEDCRVPYMALSDIDDIVGVPGFGEAMLGVGWVVLHDEKGLVFPNFSEHNVTHKMRPEPKSAADRARDYRDRKRGAARVTARHETSRREEKRREEEYIPAAPVATTETRKPRSRSQPKDAICWDFELGWRGITDTDREAWATAYPACTLEIELVRAAEWLKANPSKARKSNWRRFVVSWLTRSQDRGGTTRSAGKTPEDAFRKQRLDRKALEFSEYQPAPYRTPKEALRLAEALRLKEPQEPSQEPQEAARGGSDTPVDTVDPF